MAFPKFRGLRSGRQVSKEDLLHTMNWELLPLLRELVEYLQGGWTSVETTVSSGSAVVSSLRHTVDTEGDASTDDLDTLDVSEVPDGFTFELLAEEATRVVTVKHGTGNIRLAGASDFALNSSRRRMTLQRSGDEVIELWRADPS